MTFTLDRDGGAEVLKILAAQAVAEIASRVSAAAGETSVITMETTDRARAKVSVPADAQAKDGLLSRAASEVGLTVVPLKQRQRPPRPPRTATSGKKRGRPRKKK